MQRQARSDRGRRRLPEGLVAAVEALALRRPASTTAYVHRRVGDIARDRGLPAPSYSAVDAIVAAIDPGLRTLAVDGDTAYRDRFELLYRRSAARAKAPGLAGRAAAAGRRARRGPGAAASAGPLRRRAAEIDTDLARVGLARPEVRRLMTIPGVDAIVALSLVAAGTSPGSPPHSGWWPTWG